MTVLITGGTGFIGLNIAEALLKRGERVVLYGLDQAPPGTRETFAKLPGKCVAIPGDVLDTATLEKAFRDSEATRVINAAAITSGPARERRDPKRVMEVNVLGTLNVLEAAQRHPIRRFVQLSSASVYGASGYQRDPLGEDRPLPAPESLYGISKFAAERAALRVKQLSGLDVVAARLGAVFGPYERDTGHRDTLSPIYQTLVQAIEEQPKGGAVIVLPRPGLRDWVYARDVAAGLLLLLDAPKLDHGVYNVGSGFRWTVEDWCRRLAQRYPGTTVRLSSDPGEATVDFFGPADRASLSIERLNRELGYRPAFDLDAAFVDMMAWLDAS